MTYACRSTLTKPTAGIGSRFGINRRGVGVFQTSVKLEAVSVFVLAHLNTHQSESLVILVARLCGIEDDLGVEGKSGVLKSLISRKAFLTDKSHRIRFVFTPKPCSWLNQIEIGFSGLTRRVLPRGNFRSVDELKTKILNDIEFYNKNAKPCKWKFEPKTDISKLGRRTIG